MQQNNFIVDLIASLKKGESKKRIKSDTKSLGDLYVGLIGNLRIGATKKAIKSQLKGMNFNFNITPTVNTKGVKTATQQAVNNAQKVANGNKVHINFDVDKQKLINQMKILAKNNNKLFNNQEMTAKYNQLLNSANVAKSSKELKNLRGQLSAFKTELIATNNAGMTWGAKFKASIQRYAQFFSGASVVYAISNQLRNAATEAKGLDDRLVDLMKVTDEIGNRDALYKYFDKAMSKAKELNVKVDSLLYSITEFKKMGWGLSEAELGGEWATILENVGDVDIDTAIGSIKTAIASFDEIGGYGDDQMDKKLEAYVDLINEMSNKYSIDANGLAESIRLSAGTLTEAHTSIEQAATMFATANKYYNDPDYLGNTAKIGSLRLRASSADSDAIAELEEMGEDVDDLVESTSTLREKLLALTGVDIMQDDNTFKSYYQQLYDISQVIDTLSDTSRAGVLEAMFGKNRSAAGAALLSGMKESASAYETAINSAGSATREYETWMQGADAACQRFSNTMTETYQSIVNGNTVRDLANMGTAVLDFANSWGIVEGTLKGVLVLGIGKFLTTGTMAMITATKQVEQYGRALQLVNNIPNGNLSARYQTLKSIATATQNLTGVQLKNVLANKALTQQDRIRILQMQGMTKEMALQKLAEMNLTTATNAQTAANTASTASTFSLKSAMIGLGATMKNVFLSNPVGIALMGISLGVSAITSAVSNHNQKIEELREKTKEAADTANTLGDEVAELATKYIALFEAVKTDESAKEQLISTQAELLEKLGLEGESIDDLIAKYGSLSNAIRQASIDTLKDKQIDLIANVDVAKEDLLDVGSDGFWGGNNILNATGDDAVKAFKELEKAGIIDSGSYGSGGGSLVLIGDDKTVDGVIENYNRVKDALETLRDSEAFTQEELAYNSLWQAIHARYTELKPVVEGYTSAITELNENVAQQTMLASLQSRELPKTEEEFETFKQELVDTAIASKQFIGSEKEISDAINNHLSTVPEFAGFYSIPLENELDKVDALLGQEPSSKLSDKYKETLEALKELALSGEITPEVLTSTAAYRKLLEDTGLTAEEACEKIRDFAVGETSLSDIMGSIKSHAELINSVNEQLTENGQISFDTLQNIAKEYPTLEEYVQEYITGVEGSEQKLIDELNRCYNDDLNNYKKYYEIKLSNDGLWWNNFTENLPNWVSELTKYYGIDLKTYTSYLKAKAALDSEYEKTNNLIKLAEDSNPNSDDRKYSKTKHPFLLVNQTKEATLDIVNKDVESTDVLEDLYMKQKDLASALDEITKNFESSLDLGDIDSKFADTSFTGGSKESSSSTKPTVFDWIETKIENVSEALDNLKSKSSNTYATWTERNIALQKAISKTKDAIALQAQAYQTYMNKANSVGLSDYYKNLIQNGALRIEDITDDTIAEKISEYQKWYDKAKECLETQEDLNQTIGELNKQKFTDLQSQFDGINETTEHSIQLLQDRIDLLEMKGLFDNEKYYNSMLDYTQEHIDSLEKEKSQLQSILNGSGIKQGTSEWHDMFSALMDIDEELSSLNNQMVEYQNTIRDLNWEVFEYLENSVSRITEETEYLVNLLNKEDLFDKNGNMTKYGEAAIGLHASAYDVYKQQAKDYFEEMQELEKQLVNGAGKDVLEHYNDIVDSHRDAILAAEDEKQAILDLIEDGYNSQLDALQELIDKRKEALNAEKSLYDYQKNVKEQTDNIASLEKQQMAFSGDDSESAMSKIQQIKVDLENAKADLKETEYEKYLSDTEDLLDQLAEDYETWMNERMDNSDALLSEIVGQVSTKGDEINDTLNSVADKYGTMVSDSITSIFNSESPFTSALTEIGNDIQNVGDRINSSIVGTTTAINSLINKVANITGADASKTNAGNNVSSSANTSNNTSSVIKPNNSTSSTVSKPTNGGNVGSNSNVNSGSSSSTSKNIFEYKKDYYPKNLLNVDTSIIDRLKKSDYDSSFAARSRYWNRMGFAGAYTSSYSQNVQMLNWMKKRGYKNGTQSASKGLHLYDEEGLGSEMILTKDGAVLGRLGNFEGGETVFNKDMVKNLWDLAQMPNINLPKFEPLKVAPNMTNGGNSVTFGNVSFELPNVTNYEDFVKHAQADPKFEKMVQNMAFSKAFGQNGYSKHVY